MQSSCSQKKITSKYILVKINDSSPIETNINFIFFQNLINSNIFNNFQNERNPKL